MEGDPSRWTVRRRACAVVDAELQELNGPPFGVHEISLGQHTSSEDDLDSHNAPDSGPEQVQQEHDQTNTPSSPNTDSDHEAGSSSNLLESSESDHDNEVHVGGTADFNQEEFEIQVGLDNMIHDIGDFDSESDENDLGTVEDRLCQWANEFQNQVSHAALAGLLAALRPEFPDLPKDPRTLLSTDVNQTVLKLAGGEYYHFGLK